MKTVLDRLVDKGLATRQKDGKKFFYKSSIQRQEASRLALEKILRQYFQNDLDELLACVAEFRTKGLGVRTAVEAGLVTEAGELMLGNSKPTLKTPLAV